MKTLMLIAFTFLKLQHFAIAQEDTASLQLTDSLRLYNILINKNYHSSSQLESLYLQKGNINKKLMRYDSAIVDYTKSMEYNQGNNLHLGCKNVETWVNRGICFIYLKRYNSAIYDITKSIALLPDNFVLYELRGKIYAEFQQYNNAINDISYFLSKQPTNVEMQEYLGVLLFLKKDYRQALISSYTSIRIDSTRAEPWNCVGACYAALQMTDSAILGYSNAIRLGSTNSEYYNSRANCYARQWKYDLAADDHYQALMSSDDAIKKWWYEAEYHYDTSHLHFAQLYSNTIKANKCHHYQDAIENCNKLLHADSSDRHARYARATAYLGKEYYNNALSDLQFLESYEKDGFISWDATPAYISTPGFWNVMGICLSNIPAKNADAIVAFTKAISFDSSVAKFYDNRGLSYWRMNILDSAEHDFKRAIRLDRAYPNSLNNLGLIHFERHNYAEAIATFKQSLDLDSNNYATLMNLLGCNMSVQAKDLNIDRYATIAKAQPNFEYLLALCQAITGATYELYADHMVDYKTYLKVREIPEYKERAEFDVLSDYCDEYLEACYAYLANDKPKEAMGLLDLSLEKFQKMPIDTIKAYKLEDIYGDVLMSLGVACEQLSYLEDALYYYQKAELINPYGQAIKQKLTSLLIRHPNLHSSLMHIDQQAEHVSSQATLKGNSYAIIITNDTYNPSTGFSRLEYCKKETEELGYILSAQYGFDTAKIKKINDENRAPMLHELDNILRKLKPQDNLLICYSGHADVTTRGGVPYTAWVTVDAKNEQEYITPENLLNLFDGCRAKKILIISDACFSGQIKINHTSSVCQYTRQVITSSSNETTPSKSLFMSDVVKVLNENQQPSFTSSELYSAILRRQNQESQGRFEKNVAKPMLYNFENNTSSNVEYIFNKNK